MEVIFFSLVSGICRLIPVTSATNKPVGSSTNHPFIPIPCQTEVIRYHESHDMPFSTPLHFMASFCSFQDFEAIIITELELGERVVPKLRDSRRLLSLVMGMSSLNVRSASLPDSLPSYMS